MASWTIYGSNNVAKAVVKELELHDEWMAECYLTISVKSATPISFAVGDYIDYRGERYTIQYDPNVIKKATSGSYGEGFTYDNIKFVGLQDEVVRCDFNDIVLNDNDIHYSALPTFPFYCESVDDLLDRIQANLEDLYPGQWIIIGLNTVRNAQRGTAVGRAQAFLNAYKQYIDPTGAANTDPYGKQGVAETADNITCWDAMKKVHDDFDLNFIVRGRVIVVGTAGVFTANTFRYGKGNGLYELERIGESDQRIVTRLRAYGSEQNLPAHYYNTINKQVYATVTSILHKFDTTGADFLLDLDFDRKYFTYRSESYPGTTEAPNYIIEMMANDVTVRGYVTKDATTGKCYVYCESVAGDDDRDEPDATKMAAFVQALTANDRLDFVEYVNKDAFGTGHYDYGTGHLPDNMAVSRLMLPGFPTMSLHAWVQAHKDDADKAWLAQAIADGFTFSNEVYRPYIDSPNKTQYGVRPGSIYFDGSDDTEDVHPTIEGMTYNGAPIDEVYAADQVADNGVYPAGEEVKNIKITLPVLGFELDKVYEEGASIDMKNGMCGARSFKLAGVPKKDANGRWVCTVERVHDDALDLWFPYCDFQIHGSSETGRQHGDNYVLTGIDMPAAYIEAASVRLLQESIEALKKNHAPRYTYQPRIDELWMQRQHDTATASQGVASLHDTLKAGDVFVFADADMGVDASIIIDVLTIKENGDNGIPTYEITLRDEKQVSTIQKIQNKIDSVIDGTTQINTGVSGLNAKQVRSLIENYGGEQFLSKLNEDIAQGLIGFVKGLWVKMKGVFGIDQDGNARVNALNAESDAHLNGQTFADDIQSSNYTGEGVADTGFRLMREDAAGSSKLVVDNLYVRKKATFEELEVRKETAIAGNQIYSGAANVILRTDYYGVDDPTNHDFSSPVKLLGYSTTVVPWLLRKVPFLLNGQFFGRLRKTRVVLEDADIPKIRLVRCYFLAKDDEKETFNLWKIQEFDANNNPIDGTGNDFARCQSFNLSSSKRKTYIRSMETKAGNVYWWRKLCGLSERPVTLDDNRQYHFIDVRFDYNEEERYRQQEQQCPWCDVASGDIPAAGDQVVQFGNDMNPDRMNLIAVEVNSSSDAPAHKWYKGIYTFDLNKCWWGGNPRKDMISAASGVEFYGPEFKIVTEYGIAKVPKDRAEVEWTNITPQRDDYGTHENVRKCYNYDAITHNGSRWLCLMQDGAHWVRPQVWDDDSYALFDEDGNYKHNGDFISSTEYSQLSTSRKAQCGRVADYTTKEPSTDDEVWKKIVAKGDNSVRIDLDNENDTMLYSSSKGLVSGNVVSTGTLWDGITDVTGLATWSIVATNCTATISDNTVTVTAMSAANGSVLVKALYNGINYEKALTLKRIIDGDKYELIVTPNSIPYNSTADNPAATTLAIQIWKTACDGTRALSAPPTGFNLYANGNALTASSTGTYSYTTDNSEIDSVAIKIATSASATDSLDSETIPVVKAANGASGSGTKLMFTAAMAADATAPTVATYNDFTWNTAAASPTESLPCVYCALWKTDATGTLKELLSVSLYSRYGEKGKNGKDGWMITADPANVIITQGLGNNINDFSSAKVGFTAKKGGQTVSIDSLSPITGKQANNLSDTFNAAIGSGDDSKKVIVSSPKTYTPTGETDAVYYTQGGFEVIVNVTDPDSNTPISFNITVLCYANLLGTWKEGVVGDTKTEVARSLSYAYIQDGQGVQSLENIGTYVKSSTENISKLTQKINDGKNLLKGVLTGEDWRSESGDTFPTHQIVPVLVDSDGYLVSTVTNAHVSSPLITLNKGVDYVFSFDGESAGSVSVFIFDPSHYQDEPIEVTTSTGTRKEATFKIDGTGTISVHINTYIGKLRHPQLEIGTVATEFSAGDTEMTSSIKQTADEIEALVNDTGVDITNKNINLYADKVKFYKNKASATAGDAAKIWIDGGDGSLHAVDGNFEGTVKAKNLYHGVCIGGLEQYAYCSQLFIDTWSLDDNTQEYMVNFTVGEYYTESEVRSLSGNHLGIGSTGMVKCSYSSDIYVIPSSNNDTGGVEVFLPLATDFDGKLVEIIDTRYTQPSTSNYVGGLVVKQCDHGNGMKPSFGATPTDQVRLNASQSHDGGSYRLLSYDGYWVRLSTIGDVSN